MELMPALQVLQRHLLEREEMDAAAKLRRKMERACEVECHRAGTRACLPTGECQCRPDFQGVFCEKCREAGKFLGARGTCEPCPCPLNRSTGTCYYEKQLSRAVCRECLPSYGGYECELCAVDYHLVNSTCVPNPLTVGSEGVAGSWGGLSPAGARVALSLSIPVSLSLILLCGLVCFIAKRRQAVSRMRKGTVSEDKLVLFHEGQVTINDCAMDDYSDDDLGFGREMRRSAALRPTLVDANGRVRLEGGSESGSEEEEEGLMGSPTIRRERNSYYFLAGEHEAPSLAPVNL